MRQILCVVALVTLLITSHAAFAQRSTPVQVVHPAGAANDQFGYAVAVDGDTMIVGAFADDVGANADQGSAHVYRWTGSGWTFESTLTAADGAAGDSFGRAVAISGDTVIVGALGDDASANADQGSAYVFTRSGTTWTQQAKLIAANGAASDFLGIAVAISGDTAVVGASGDDVGANANQGSAYVFVRVGAAWSQQAQLTASNGAPSDSFGLNLALSGDTVIVGAYLDDVGANVDQGSAYVFTRAGTTWTQQTQLSAGDGAAIDNFGISVAVSGDTVVVGALSDDIGANVDQGSAYVFTRNATTWTQQAKITASDGAANDNFGARVALSDHTIVVGATGDDVGATSDQGSAYVYARSATTWTQQAQLTASDGATGDQFGISVVISGDTAVVGASTDDVGPNSNQGSAWVFSRIGSKWIGPDLTLTASGGAANDQFGSSVAISGDTAVVGAMFDDVGANANQGSAYIFVRSGTSWTQQAQLTAIGGAANDLFGNSIAISGDTAIVGARTDDVGANADQGSAYVFTRSGTTWTQQAQLTAIGGATGDQFGVTVAISGDTAVVGASADDVGPNADQGSAYVFTRSGTTWTQQAQLFATDGAPGDRFGHSVALSGETAIVGAFLDGVGGNVAQGSAYVFVRNGTNWTQQAQLTAIGGATFDDFGLCVAISGDTAIVGAPFDNVGTYSAQGSAYIFVRSGTAWTQQAQLNDIGGAAGDQFGIAVALSGDTAIVGAYIDDVGANADQGAAYVFTRSGMTWTQQAQLTATGGAAVDQFGISVALSGDTAVTGAWLDDVGANGDQGSAWFFDVPDTDFSLAHNDVSDVSYRTMSAALLPAQTGQQITATEAAWRTAASVDTAGRSLILQASGNIRTPSTTAVTLGGSSSLLAAAGDAIEVFGQLRVSSGASADVWADSFRLGSRGILTARTGSSLTINAPTADLDGQTRLEQSAALTFSGSATAIGSTNAALNSSITTGGTFTNIDTFTITAGTITAPLFFNRAQANIFGTSAVFGSFSNDFGATTTIRSGTLFVFGSLTNNGTFIGTVCASCVGTPPDIDVSGDLAIGPAASLTWPFLNSLVRVGGDFDCAINSNTRYDMSLATLQLEGGGPEQTLEVMSTDIGADPSGLDRTLPGHYPIRTLHIGPSPSLVRLVDARDNDGAGQGVCEAIYVDTLQIDAGSRLINTSCTIYYNTLVNNGSVDVPTNLVPIVACSCPADFDGSGGTPDITDIDAFFTAWLVGDPAADADCSGGTPDTADIDAFFTAWLAGGC
jgi:hypothetical protein